MMQSTGKKTLLVVCGPTAVGKTACCVKLARHFEAPIVSADARQFYREMNKGTAKPTPEERKQATHYFVDFLSIETPYTVYDYEQAVMPFLEQLFRKHSVVILSGGSGLFVKAVCEGLDKLPETDPSHRDALHTAYETSGLQPLQEELRKKDPDFYREADLQNPRRVIRALEVIRSTGSPFSAFRSHKPARRPFDIVKTALWRPREELYERINRRCDVMISNGLPEEVRTLYPYKHLPALQTIGYREFFPWVEERISFDEATETFKTASRRYAKRQRTWFRNDPEIQWFQPNAHKAITHLI